MTALKCIANVFLKDDSATKDVNAIVVAIKPIVNIRSIKPSKWQIFDTPEHLKEYQLSFQSEDAPAKNLNAAKIIASVFELV